MYQMLVKIFREPESPVITTSLSLGISKLIFFKLFCFAPLIIIGSQIAHSFGHQNAKVQQASNNYKELKAAQENIRQDVVEEEIDNQIEKMSIKELHEKYEEMLMQPKPIINAQTTEPISFEEFVKLATTRV